MIMGRPKKSELTVSQNREEEFPFDQFPYKLIHADGKETRKCYFQSEEHRKKHIDRYNLKKKDITLSYKYD
jgi:hypothetical protein